MHKIQACTEKDDFPKSILALTSSLTNGTELKFD